MPDLQEATKRIQQELLGGKIQAHIDYNGLYVFQVFTTNPAEEEMDPFYSIDKKTGEFSDFSIITDGDPAEISRLFVVAKNTTGATLSKFALLHGHKMPNFTAEDFK